jgi:hypothetical protein
MPCEAPWNTPPPRPWIESQAAAWASERAVRSEGSSCMRGSADHMRRAASIAVASLIGEALIAQNPSTE